MPSLLQIWPFLGSRSFSKILAQFGQHMTQEPGNENFQKMKKKNPGFHPNYKCAKFQQGPTNFRLSRLPRRLWPIWGKTGPWGQNIKIFKKWEKPPQVFTQTTSVPNFNKVGLFLGSLGCSKDFGPFWAKRVKRAEKWKFSKYEKNPKQLFTQATKVCNVSWRSDHF